MMTLEERMEQVLRRWFEDSQTINYIGLSKELAKYARMHWVLKKITQPTILGKHDDDTSRGTGSPPHNASGVG